MKYKLTKETIEHNGRTLHRIEAVSNFGDVKKGDKGGFIEKEENLSQKGNCWVYDNAKVSGDAELFDTAWVCDDARVSGNVKVSDNAWVYGDIKIERGYFFGCKRKDEELTFVDLGDDHEAIAKGEVVLGEDKPARNNSS